MGILGRQTVLAKCPACQATTKVKAHPDKPSIRCPRCKATIPLTFARKYTPGQPEQEVSNPTAQQVDHTTQYTSGLPVSHDQHTSAHANKQRQRRNAYGTPTEVSYPDHAAGFVRYSIIIAVIAVLLAAVGVAYFIWKDTTDSKYQEYVNNVRESLEQHQTALANMKKRLDPLEANEAEKNFREAKGKIAFLAYNRKRMMVPSTPDESLKDLMEEHTKAEKELVQAEEDHKRLSNQIQTKPDTKVPEVVSPELSSSATKEPPRTPSTSIGNEPRKAVDANAVGVILPGISKAQWNDEFSKRFSLLADNEQGQVTVKWSGDLLTLEVRPVLDPARYATKINFGKLLYYSRNDRTLTIEFKPERVNNYVAQGDLITPLLITLKQREKMPNVQSALSELSSLKVDPARQAEVATVLETVAIDGKLDATMRIMAIKLIPAWSGKESAELLIRLMDDKASSVRLTAIDALVETHSPLAAAALVKNWDKLEAERITHGLIALGSDAESAVLPFLNNTSNIAIRVEACRALRHIGTAESLKPLLDLMNVKDQDPAIATAAKEAMKQILDRKTK